jgi:hypothetical protein
MITLTVITVSVFHCNNNELKQRNKEIEINVLFGNIHLVSSQGFQSELSQQSQIVNQGLKNLKKDDKQIFISKYE